LIRAGHDRAMAWLKAAARMQADAAYADGDAF
jgi:hypothetical protein